MCRMTSDRVELQIVSTDLDTRRPSGSVNEDKLSDKSWDTRCLAIVIILSRSAGDWVPNGKRVPVFRHVHVHEVTLRDNLPRDRSSSLPQ